MQATSARQFSPGALMAPGPNCPQAQRGNYSKSFVLLINRFYPLNASDPGGVVSQSARMQFMQALHEENECSESVYWNSLLRSTAAFGNRAGWDRLPMHWKWTLRVSPPIIGQSWIGPGKRSFALSGLGNFQLVGSAEFSHSHFESRLLKTVSDHRCEITGVKLWAGLLNR